MQNSKFSSKSLISIFCTFLAGLGIYEPAARSADYCVKDTQIAAVDLSAPVDQAFLNQMQASGINTIIRYYDHEDETLPGKTLRKIERDLILETLKHCLGNRTHAANILGISIRTLRNKLNEYVADGTPVPPPGGGEIRGAA